MVGWSDGRSTVARIHHWSSTHWIWPSGTKDPAPGGIVHADHGVQLTSWAFTNKIRSAGMMPSFGTVGDGDDNAMRESFWSAMRIVLLNRKKWMTRTDPANAIFEYIEIFYNRQRRHTGLDYRTPIEHELHSKKPQQSA